MSLPEPNTAPGADAVSGRSEAPVQAVPGELRVFGIRGLPEVAGGADIAALVADAAGGTLRDGDVLVVTSKIVSKAEGRVLVAADREKAIDAETVRVVARRRHPGGETRIVETRQGLVLAAAGVDASNT